MSDCLKKKTLLAFADRELPPSDLELAERHITICAACKQQLESIRATSLKVNALLSSLAPDELVGANAVAVIRIPHTEVNARIRWTALVSVGALVAVLVLFVMIHRHAPTPEPSMVKSPVPAPMPSVEKKEVLAAALSKPVRVGVPKAPLKVRQFQALDDGEPIETGMIYRVDLPASSIPNAAPVQSAKRIPAEVIVDEFGKVRAIRFLQ